MKDSLLNYLRCLDCDQPFKLQDVVREADNEIAQGRLICSRCPRSYPVRNGIPRIIPETIEPLRTHTAHRFGQEWQMFDDLGEGFERELLKEFIHPLTPSIFKDALVLEAGCGGGRNIRRIAEYGAREVIGVDLGIGVEVAYRKTRDLPNVHVIQADIYNIPLAQNFDVVFSAGVLHHLPNPQKGFDSVRKHARPGGWVVNTVYGKENNAWLEHLVTPLRVRVTQHLPVPVLYALSFLITCPVYLLLRGVYQPLNEIAWTRPLAARLFYNDFGYRMVRLGFRSVFAQIYDQLTAPVAFFIPRQDVESWMAHANLEEPRTYWRNKNAWNFVGRRPQAPNV